MEEFKNRRWLVIPISIVDTINFGEVIDNSKDNLRYSIDKTKTFVKYDVNEVLEDTTVSVINPETQQTSEIVTKKGIYGRPSFYSDDYKEYTHEQILELLSTPEWTTPLQNKIK